MIRGEGIEMGSRMEVEDRQNVRVVVEAPRKISQHGQPRAMGELMQNAIGARSYNRSY